MIVYTNVHVLANFRVTDVNISKINVHFEAMALQMYNATQHFIFLSSISTKAVIYMHAKIVEGTRI